jgi:phosphatidate cytidylyltransferase
MDYKIFITRFISSLFLIIILIIGFLHSIYLIALFVLLIYAVIFYEIKSYFNYNNLSIYLYVFTSLVIVEIYLLFYLNIYFIFNYILIVIFFDSYSYIFGTIFGKNKILKKITPNKTYEGLFFGYFLTLLNIFIINNYTEYFINIITMFIVSTLIMILAFIGDLFQSFLKRKSNIKNSSNLLPGHGGFFDRLDGYILSSYVFPLIIIL